MANLPKDVTESLDKINKYLDSSGKDVQTVVQGMKKHFESETRSAKVNSVCSSIKKIGDSVDAFKSGDALKIFSSVLDITSSISEIIPEGGPFISAACSLFSAVLGAVGSGDKKSMADVAKEVIEEALDNYEDSELRAEVEGTLRVYSDSLAYLNFDAGTKLTEGEVCNLSSFVPIHRGINMLGILKSKVNDSAMKNDLTHGKRAIAYTSLYVKLAILRTLIFMQMQALIKSSGHSQHTVEAIQRLADKEEKSDKEFIRYLATPTYDKAYLFVQLSPSEEPLLSVFLHKHGLKFQRLEQLTRGANKFSPKKWPEWYIQIEKKPLIELFPTSVKYIGTMSGKKTQGFFYFKALNLEDSLFYICSQEWPNLYVHMGSSDVYCSERRQEYKCEWKVIQYEDGYFMLSLAESPNRFLYMNWAGYIKDWEGDPGPQGHWYIC